jgi:hypothetical protein
MYLFRPLLHHVMQGIFDAGRCRVTLPYIGEFRWTKHAPMSNMTLCNFIQLILRMTSILWPLKIMRFVWKIRPTNSSETFYNIRLASTRPPGVLITYGASVATSDNLAFLAQMELIKSCDTPESNSLIIGQLWRKNVLICTSSLVGIPSTVV